MIIFQTKQHPAIAMMEGDTITVRGPIYSTGEGFFLDLNRVGVEHPIWLSGCQCRDAAHLLARQVSEIIWNQRENHTVVINMQVLIDQLPDHLKATNG